MNPFLAVLLLTLFALPMRAEVLGFGETSRGGTGGRTILVTRRDDNPQHPLKGSLRWALRQRGPRIVKFALSGDIKLQDRIMIREPFLTIDGSDAPREGVTIRDGSLMFRDTHDIVVRQVRIRLGEEAAARQRREYHTKRPLHSAGLDCVSLDDSRRIVFDHCSLSWSCDEIFGITRCRDVTIQWCILSEPLASPRLHPYGDRHAFPINASASTLSVHHCLIAHFVMRGPQFEANDMRPQDQFTVKMEAVNNVIFDYEQSGARYGCGVEKDNGTAKNKQFQFQFLNNLFIADSSKKPPIEAITKHGIINAVKIGAAGNECEIYNRSASGSPSTPRAFASGKGPVWNETITPTWNLQKRIAIMPPFWNSTEEARALNSQTSMTRLFTTTASRHPESASDAAEHVLRKAGCTQSTDATDTRAMKDVESHRFGQVVKSVPQLFSLFR